MGSDFDFIFNIFKGSVFFFSFLHVLVHLLRLCTTANILLCVSKNPLVSVCFSITVKSISTLKKLLVLL